MRNSQNQAEVKKNKESTQPAQAPGTVTVCGLVCGSSCPAIPSARTRSIVSAAGVRPGQRKSIPENGNHKERKKVKKSSHFRARRIYFGGSYSVPVALRLVLLCAGVTFFCPWHYGHRTRPNNPASPDLAQHLGVPVSTRHQPAGRCGGGVPLTRHRPQRGEF